MRKSTIWELIDFAHGGHASNAFQLIIPLLPGYNVRAAFKSLRI
jgi:hypothetical protein